MCACWDRGKIITANWPEALVSPLLLPQDSTEETCRRVPLTPVYACTFPQCDETKRITPQRRRPLRVGTEVKQGEAELHRRDDRSSSPPFHREPGSCNLTCSADWSLAAARSRLALARQCALGRVAPSLKRLREERGRGALHGSYCFQELEKERTG